MKALTRAAQQGGNPLPAPSLCSASVSNRSISAATAGLRRPVSQARATAGRAGGGDVPRLARLLGPGVHRFEHRRGRSREFRHPHSIAPQLCRDSLAVLALGVVLRLANPAQAVAKRSRRDARLGPLQLRGGASEYSGPPAQAPKLFGLSVDRRAAAPVHPSARASSSNRAWVARGSR